MITDYLDSRCEAHVVTNCSNQTPDHQIFAQKCINVLVVCIVLLAPDCSTRVGLDISFLNPSSLSSFSVQYPSAMTEKLLMLLMHDYGVRNGAGNDENRCRRSRDGDLEMSRDQMKEVVS